MTPSEMAAFERLETAIDQHPSLTRLREAECLVSRLGYTVAVRVKLKNSRKSPLKIKGDGDTLEEACGDLIQKLDTWAEALK